MFVASLAMDKVIHRKYKVYDSDSGFNALSLEFLLAIIF